MTKPIPNVETTTRWIVPLVRSILETQVPDNIHAQWSHQRIIHQPIVMGLVDHQTKRPKRISDLYATRTEQLRATLESSLGDNYWVFDNARVDWRSKDTQTAEGDNDALMLLPRWTSYLSTHSGTWIKPGTANKSSQGYRISFFIKRFVDASHKTAFLICR